MSHPIPRGTRDVLPDEMRELRALLNGFQAAFDRAGYGEVLTPTVEYDDILRLGDDSVANAGYRLFDDQGRLLVLRSDMTIPIARLVSNRFRDHDGPLRLCYSGHAYRNVQRGSAQPSEFLQAGIELIGVEGPEGDAEVLEVALASLEAAGLRRHRIGVGDGALYRRLLEAYEVPAETGDELMSCLARRDLAGLERAVREAGVAPALMEVPALRGGPQVLERDEPALDGLRALHELLASRGLEERLIFDLGLVHELGYYTGAIFEVYDPAVGFALGGGGRYDDLIGRFGDPRPACGMALDVQRVHVAQAAEEKLA